MGKNASVSDWHRQQRKKELAKNKQARIQARDERVVAEKTSREIKEEIRKLERQHKNAEQRPHAIQSKLDRLDKELKLVTAKEEKDKEERKLTLEQQKRIEQQQAREATFQPLENPAVSIYYDPVMNPFGAPPPGRPRLFHRRGGGTTMNLNEACTLQEQFLPPPPPPPPPRPPPPPPVQHRHPQPQQQHRNQQRRMESNTSNRSSAPPPPPASQRKASIDQNQSSNKPNLDGKTTAAPKQQHKQQLPQKKTIDPAQLPSLPKPSAAVERSRKRHKLAADIWASTEEIEYEQAVTGTGLEGTVSNTTAQENADIVTPTQWFYRDTAGQVQGPFTLDAMLQWVQAGYFPETTPVAGSAQGPFQPMRQTKAFRKALQPSSSPSLTKKQNEPAAKEQSVHDRIAALRNESQQQQQQQQQASSRETESEEAAESSVTDRIAALRREGNEDEQQEESVSDSVQSRIAALRAERMKEEQPDGGSDNDDDKPENTVQDRIAALRAQRSSGNDETNASIDPGEPLPPPPARSAAVDQDGAPSYPIDDGVPPYPAGDGDEAPAYHIDDADVEYDVPYPVDDAYPATGEYPIDDGEGADADGGEYYPAVGAYPLESGAGSNPVPTTEEEEEEEPSTAAPLPPKKIKVDQAVVSLLPSHLQKKRQSTTKRPR